MELTLQWEYEYCFRSFYSYYNPCFYGINFAIQLRGFIVEQAIPLQSLFLWN